MTDEFHIPVLRDEVRNYLRVMPDGIYVDGTLGGGGHTEDIASKLSSLGRVIAFDRDADAIRFARHRLEKFRDRIMFVHDNYSSMNLHLQRLGFGAVDGVILDLGVSSFQLDEPLRGFSFQRDSALDMRMDNAQSLDANRIINTYTADDLANVFWKNGEERNSRKIARAIIEERSRSPIRSTRELAEIIERAIGGRFLQKSLARIFQALRIEVNGELDSLGEGLGSALAILRTGGRLVVIAYHSLEDRIVKDFFRHEARTTLPSGTKLVPDREIVPRLRILTKKPIVPRSTELADNSRARSAKLRAAERV